MTKVVTSIRTRLTALKKKMEVISKRNKSMAAQITPNKPPPNPITSPAPAVASTPPR